MAGTRHGLEGSCAVRTAKDGERRIIPNTNRGEHEEALATATLKEASRKLQGLAATLRQQLGDDDYYQLEAVFREMPFIWAMSRYSQLRNTIDYLDMNPQRLATCSMPAMEPTADTEPQAL